MFWICEQNGLDNTPVF